MFVDSLIHTLGAVSKELTVFTLAVLPVSELRGAIPVGILVFHFGFVKTVALALAGNLLPVIPILLFFDRIEKYMRRSHLSGKMIDWFLHRAEKKSRAVKKYGPLGLMLFVAVPLPVTGAWTGSLVAFLLGFAVKKSFLYIALGVCIAAVVVSSLTYGGVLIGGV